MKKFISILILTGAALMQVQAQNEVDALRYSRLILDGTSRFMATGGAFGAVGADFSVLGINPAGIAIYKKSELTFTPSIHMGGTESTYNGQSMSDTRSNFNLGNAGWVFTFNTGNGGDKPQWNNVNFGFGFNKYNNFNNRMAIQGPNNGSSLLLDYAADAEGSTPSELGNFTTGMAFDTWLIDTAGSSTHYNSVIGPGRPVNQIKSIESSGAINEMVISFGGNYSDKLYLGGTFGFPFVKYHETSSYSETAEKDSVPGFKSFSLNDEITTSGSGFNFKFGMIYRVHDWVRFGLAVHTPTMLAMHDKYSRAIESHFEDGVNDSEESLTGKFDYEITTPMRAIGSIAFLINKMGFISADYEFVDYSEARLGSSDFTFYSANAAAQANYTTASNIRVGTEWNLYPIILRGGYAMYGSPYRSGVNDGGKRTSISGGIGLREDQYFLDISYVYSMMSEDYYLYRTATPANIDFATHTLLLTFGIKY